MSKKRIFKAIENGRTVCEMETTGKKNYSFALIGSYLSRTDIMECESQIKQAMQFKYNGYQDAIKKFEAKKEKAKNDHGKTVIFALNNNGKMPNTKYYHGQFFRLANIKIEVGA